MKKWMTGLLVSLMLCLIPLIGALAWKGTITASSLNMRASNSTESKVVRVLKKGASVEAISSKGSWYKIKFGGNTGYVAKKYVKKGSSESSSKSESSSRSDSSSKSSSGKAGDPCSPGDSGAAVKAVQKKLKSLGYYSGSVDGDYGNGTKSAVKAFQKANGLTANGVANSKTISKMNSSGAKKSSSGSSGSGGGGSSGLKTESLNWFKHPDRIPHHAKFQVKDIKTGKVFNVKRWTGSNHADCEPATARDTSIMKSIYGHWSWKRRPILVKYNGRVYAASMNGMPHGTGTIKNNNFDGHFCIHFTGSKTHGSKKVDSAHQNCVKTALKHSW